MTDYESRRNPSIPESTEVEGSVADLLTEAQAVVQGLNNIMQELEHKLEVQPEVVLDEAQQVVILETLNDKLAKLLVLADKMLVRANETADGEKEVWDTTVVQPLQVFLTKIRPALEFAPTVKDGLEDNIRRFAEQAHISIGEHPWLNGLAAQRG